MDIIAHGIWSAIIYSGQPRRTAVQGIVWGIAPDLIPSAFALALAPATGFAMSNFRDIYPITHSLVIFGAALLAATLWRRAVPLPMLAWGLHVLVDIPGHQRFQTPFLFPISDYHVMGLWEWLSPPMLLVNYAAIIAVTAILSRRRRAQRLREAEEEESPAFEAAVPQP